MSGDLLSCEFVSGAVTAVVPNTGPATEPAPYSRAEWALGRAVPGARHRGGPSNR